MVNFEKMTMLGDIFLRVREYQAQRYIFETNFSIQGKNKNRNKEEKIKGNELQINNKTKN